CPRMTDGVRGEHPTRHLAGQKGPGGPDPSGPPGESGKWGRSSLTDRGEFPRPKPSVNLKFFNRARRSSRIRGPGVRLKVASPFRIDRKLLVRLHRVCPGNCRLLGARRALLTAGAGTAEELLARAHRASRFGLVAQRPIRLPAPGPDRQHLAVGVHRAATEILVDD